MVIRSVTSILGWPGWSAARKGVEVASKAAKPKPRARKAREVEVCRMALDFMGRSSVFFRVIVGGRDAVKLG
jgi:hypothetical protein